MYHLFLKKKKNRIPEKKNLDQLHGIRLPFLMEIYEPSRYFFYLISLFIFSRNFNDVISKETKSGWAVVRIQIQVYTN